MAKNDMRLSMDFVDHIKTKKLIRKNGFKSFYSLIKLFSVVGKQYPKGLLKDCSVEDIEDLAEWNEDSGSFVDALISIRFLDKTKDGYAIHDWKEHQPWIYNSEERSKKAKLAADIRWEGKYRNADSMLNADNADADCNAPNPNPNPDPDPIPIPIPTPIPKPKRDITPTKGKSGSKKFIKPSVDELKEYCKDRKNTVDSEKFFDFYESKGWKVGKNEMKDWKASVRTWEKGDNTQGRASLAPPNKPSQRSLGNTDRWNKYFAEEEAKNAKQG